MFCKIVFVVLVMILLYFSAEKLMNKMNNKESFVSSNCPTMMVKKGGKIMVYDPKMAKIPGVNPIYLKSLKEYKDYVKWQRASGLNCPILNLEKEFDAQGFEMYKINKSFSGDYENTGSSFFNHNLPVIQKEPPMSLLLDANQTNNVNFNQNMYPSYDPYGQYIGKRTSLDFPYSSVDDSSTCQK